MAVGLLKNKPPSGALKNMSTVGYLAGLLEGEGYFYYTRYPDCWYPCIYLKMREREPVEFFCRTMNVRLTDLGGEYVGRVKGLRAVFLCRIISRFLKGKRKATAELFELGGSRVTNKEIIKQYRQMYQGYIMRRRANHLRSPRSQFSMLQPSVGASGHACRP